MAEERSGDIDPGGGDLTLTFSIVGENPNEFKYVSTASDEANAKYEASLKKAKAKETGKLLKSVAQSAGSQALSIIGI
jgi:predicted alpha/beta hydrolase